MFFKNTKLRYKKLLVIIIPLFVALAACGFFTYSSILSTFGNNEIEKKDSFNINSMDYHLRSNATEYQIELFSELNDLITNEADDVAIAESVVKNYIADVYTWNNKKGQWDVGGMYYVYSPMKVNIYLKEKDYFYGQLDKYIEEYGSDNLLEVLEIETISAEKSTEKYSVDGKMYDCFAVHCKWEYTSNSNFASEIDNSMFFEVIKNDDGRFEIVATYEDI